MHGSRSRQRTQVSPRSSFEVDAPSYHSKVTCVDAERLLFLTERKQYFAEPTTLIETYSSSWFLGFTDNSSQWLAIRSGEKYVALRGPSAVFVPPFTIIEWRIAAGPIEWKALTSGSLPPRAPAQAMVFLWSDEIPVRPDEMLRAMEEAHRGVPILEGRTPNASAQQLKRWLDDHFTEEQKISEIAQKFGRSREFMTRSFVKGYGLTPLEYRLRLRIFEACRLMDMGLDVTQAAYDSGFSDLSQFIHHFRRILGTTPVRYNPEKMQRRSERLSFAEA